MRACRGEDGAADSLTSRVALSYATGSSDWNADPGEKNGEYNFSRTGFVREKKASSIKREKNGEHMVPIFLKHHGLAV